MLDSRYFEPVDTKQNHGSILESFKAVYTRSTMVLFSSKTRTPLAALTLKSVNDIGCLSMLTGRPPPKDSTEPHFQGMLSMPNQSFSFVITNLSDDGMINFNVLHTPHRVSNVNPGPAYGINEVNELSPNESYEIEADQRTNRVMVLQGKTKEKYDPITKKSKRVPLTVDEAETTEDKAKEGLYFYLSVVPDVVSRELVKFFEEGTIWKAVPGFVRKARPRRGILRDAGPIDDESFADIFDSDSDPSGAESSDEGNAAAELTSSSPPLRISAKRSTPTKRGGRIMNLFTRKSPRMEKGSAFGISVPLASVPSLGDGISNFSTKPSLHVTGISCLSSKSPVKSDTNDDMEYEFLALTPRRSARRMDNDSESDKVHVSRFEGFAQAAFSSESSEDDSDEEMNGKEHRSLGSNAFAASVEVGNTQAGELAYGEAIAVSSGYTGIEYAYEHASEPTVLCMSIWEDMKFLPLLDTLEKMLEAEMEEWIDNEGKVLIESLNVVFKEETCVIDLESEADTIICTCGHQCINHANIGNDLRRCPLCRSPITAFVRADGIVM
ncbi:hypothetical protein HJC23_001059 [Cyclotella cryptica]|uniref:RING-type domain-containing protein n=1 Tax=Cyclotella cryptica TaxID=29204 RepID=A0ABD3QI56_9STRA